MAVTKAKKEEQLQELNVLFSKAKAVYFAKNTGLTVKQIGDLRKKLHAEKVDYRVAKKTLMQIAAQKNGLQEIPTELMEGSVGAVFGYGDVIAPVKVLDLFSKEAEKLEILGGLVEGRYVSRAEAKSLAVLPSREELLAKLVGSMKAPISGFHGALAGVLRKFVYALKAVQEKKGTSPAASNS